jgi:hypothetical protein
MYVKIEIGNVENCQYSIDMLNEIIEKYNLNQAEIQVVRDTISIIEGIKKSPKLR